MIGMGYGYIIRKGIYEVYESMEEINGLVKELAMAG